MVTEFLSSGLVLGSGGVVGILKFHKLFFGLLFEGPKAEKWGKYPKKKFFINNFIEALILFKKELQGLLKLHVALIKYRLDYKSVGVLSSAILTKILESLSQFCEVI